METEPVPGNFTHLLQPLDLTTNNASKKVERQDFNNYFRKTICKALQDDPNIDVTSIKVEHMWLPSHYR